MRVKFVTKEFVVLAILLRRLMLLALFILFTSLAFLFLFPHNKSLIARLMGSLMDVMADSWRALMLTCKSRGFRQMLITLILRQFQEWLGLAKKMVEHLRWRLLRTLSKGIARLWLINLIMALYRLESQDIVFNFTQAEYSATATITWTMRWC